MAQMEKIKSGVFKKILIEEQSTFNSLFVMSKQLNMRLDPDFFLSKVSEIIDPLLIKFQDREYSQLKNMTVSFYKKILELCSKEILGSEGKYPEFENNFLLLLDNFPELLFSETENFVSAAANSILNIISFDEKKIDLWTDKVIMFKNKIKSLNHFQENGFAAAWTTGFSCYRETAIGLLKKMDNEEIKLMLELENVFKDENEKSVFFNSLQSNPWANPKAILSTGKKENLFFETAGNFSGFEGYFLSPPEVVSTENGFVVSDGKNKYKLYADFFGKMFIKDTGKEIANKTKTVNTDIGFKNYNILSNGKTFSIPEKYKLPVLSSAMSGYTVCYTSALSHKVFIAGIGLTI
jgi:hypothetical protein